MKNYAITVNGQTYQVQVEEMASSSPVIPKASVSSPIAPFAPNVPTAPVPTVVAVPDVPAAPVPTVAAAPAASSKGSIKVISPMPGKILGIKASVGQNVKAGEAIVILEAMKMENEIVAPSDGVIASIDVSNGDAVEVSQVLATLN